MSHYKVVTAFTDLTDGSVYHSGDLYPLGDIVVSDDRLKELSTTNNKRGIVLIKKLFNEGTEKVIEDIKVELPNFNQLNKKQIIELGQVNGVVDINMQMTKRELITAVKEQL